MTYTLHYAPDNASLIVRLALEHAQIAYTTTLVDRAAGAQHSQAYRQINPNGLIPALETPQGPIFETGAILLWLGDTHGNLGPAPDHADRAAYLKWLFFTANTLHPALRMMFYPEKYAGAEAAAQAAMRTVVEGNIKTALHTLDQFGATRPDWLIGSGLSFYLACILRWSALYPTDYDKGWFDLEATPHLADMCRRLETLSCTAAAQTAEGLGDTPFSNPSYATPPEGSAT